MEREFGQPVPHPLGRSDENGGVMSLLKAGVAGFLEALQLSRDLVVIPTVALVSAVHQVGKAYLSRTDGPNRKPMPGHAQNMAARFPQAQTAPRQPRKGK